MSKPGKSWPLSSKGARTPGITEFRTGSPVSKKSTDEPRRLGLDPRRVASYLNLGNRANSEPLPPPPLPSPSLPVPRPLSPLPPLPTTTTMTTGTGKVSSSLLVREEDRVPYSPNVELMVEGIQAGLINRDAMEPIPLHYNACIMAMIEAWGEKDQTIRDLEAKITEAHGEHGRTKEHTKKLADEWLHREKQYKAEIKRLELLLAKESQEGVAAVTLARAGSVVDRHGPEAKKFASELRRLSDHNHQAEEKEPGKRKPPTPKPKPKLRNPDLFGTDQPSIFSGEFTDELNDIIKPRPEPKPAPKPLLPGILDEDIDHFVGIKVQRAEAADARAKFAARTAARAAAREAYRAERNERRAKEAEAKGKEQAGASVSAGPATEPGTGPATDPLPKKKDNRFSFQVGDDSESPFLQRRFKGRSP